MKKIKPKMILLGLLIMFVAGMAGHVIARSAVASDLKSLETNDSDRFPKVRARVSERVIRQLQEESGDLVTVTFTDYSDSNFDYENNKFKGIDIRTPEATELLFACIRNCERIEDLTNVSVDDYFLPLEINGQYGGNFVRMYFKYRFTGQPICIYFSEEDSQKFFEYVTSYLSLSV